MIYEEDKNDGNNIGQDKENRRGFHDFERGTGNRRDKSSRGTGIEEHGLHRLLLSTAEGRHLGGSGNEEASSLLRADAGAGTESQRKTLVEWAKNTGRLYDKTAHEAIKELPHDKNTWGIESEVYLKDKDTVTKVMAGTVQNSNPSRR